MAQSTFSRAALLNFLTKRCAPQSDDAGLRESEKQIFHAMLGGIAATLETGSNAERAALAAELRALQPTLSVGVPHTVGIWLSRHVEQQIHPQALTDDGTTPMVGFMIRAWTGDKPHTPNNDEWTTYLPLATVDLFDWMDPRSRWWTIYKAAYDAIAALGLPYYLWPEAAHGHIGAAIVDRPDVQARLITRTEIVPVMAIGANNRLCYVATTTTTGRAA